MQKPAANQLPIQDATVSPAKRAIPDEAWRVFLPEDEPVDPLPEIGDFDWEVDSNWEEQTCDDCNDAA